MTATPNQLRAALRAMGAFDVQAVNEYDAQHEGEFASVWRDDENRALVGRTPLKITRETKSRIFVAI